ncbi:MAG TPA: ABC transporter ATP-binding protein [Desulfobacterales bacterium]|nr:ABC transporter ATP-binding protein [Desulfobacterales bacterium]HIP38428.1 ABC transporter ATP-binding protein [Desulfocapsa sulfexigens]
MFAQPIARLRGVVKNYHLEGGNIHVLRDVDFSVCPGEFVAITGASGSGKSTLLHICGCLDRPSEGTYELAGENVGLLSDDQLADLRQNYIGFVFQDFNLLPYASVYENVALPFLYSTLEPGEWKPLVLQAIDDVGLTQRLRHRPSALSGGERQRVAIARAIVCKPKLILADEPTGNLDSVTSREILTLFLRLHDNGATILLVTHDQDVAGIASRLMTMKDGRLSEKA